MFRILDLNYIILPKPGTEYATTLSDLLVEIAAMILEFPNVNVLP